MILDDLGVSISARDRRTLTVGVSVIVILLLLSKGAPAWLAWERHAASRALLAVTDAAAADAVTGAYEVTRDSLRVRLRRLTALDSVIVPGIDQSTAAASLATIVSDASTDAGVTIGSLQPAVDSPPRTLGGRRITTEPPFASVSVRGDATGDVVGLMQFVADLEHGPALISVRDLAITQTDPLASSDRMEVLHAKFTVGGLARRGTTPNTTSDASWQSQTPAPSPPIPSR